MTELYCIEYSTVRFTVNFLFMRSYSSSVSFFTGPFTIAIGLLKSTLAFSNRLLAVAIVTCADVSSSTLKIQGHAFTRAQNRPGRSSKRRVVFSSETACANMS